MAGASTKKVNAESEAGNTILMARAKDGTTFAKCEECDKDVPVAVIGFHSCGLDAIIQMKMEADEVLKPLNEGKKKPTARKKPTSTEPNAKKPKTETAKDKKKRPTAFFIFMADFRKEYKEAHPDSKLIKEVSKQAGEKWKSMSDEEKKHYHEKAAELKADYDKPSETNS